MMKCCCLIAFIFCTIDVSNGGILSGKCLASNGTCGTKGVPCNVTFGSDWTYNGKCCNNRPCCKFFKPPCIPAACPDGYRLLPNQTGNDHCYRVFFEDTHKTGWLEAKGMCNQPPTGNGYLWRPNTEQEANAVQKEFNIPNFREMWTGANDKDGDGNYTFDGDNGPFSFNSLPFGLKSVTPRLISVFVMIMFIEERSTWLWKNITPDVDRNYVCEYQIPCQ